MLLFLNDEYKVEISNFGVSVFSAAYKYCIILWQFCNLIGWHAKKTSSMGDGEYYWKC